MKAQKIHLLVYLFLGVIISSFIKRPDSTDQGIQFFQGTWKEAVAKASEEKKCIFLDAFASWCGPCKTMDNEVYTDSAVGNYFNKKFIAIKIDMEKGEGPELAKRLPSIDGYPSLLFFGADGHLTKTILGSRSANEFLQEAKLVGK
jgi:thiol:disulfide interchange protein